MVVAEPAGVLAGHEVALCLVDERGHRRFEQRDLEARRAAARGAARVETGEQRAAA